MRRAVRGETVVAPIFIEHIQNERIPLRSTRVGDERNVLLARQVSLLPMFE